MSAPTKATATITISDSLRSELRNVKAQRGGLTYDEILRAELELPLEDE